MIGIFGGTREGRLLAEFCRKEGLLAAVSVATSYGKGLLEEGPGLQSHGDRGLRIQVGRMDKERMKEWIKEMGIRLVIDATHPYARDVTCQIRQACKENGIPCLRLVREKAQSLRDPGLLEPLSGAIRWVPSVAAAADCLKEELAQHPKRRALITTGSKELSWFAAVDPGKEGLYARVLPTAEGIEACLKAGVKGSHIIAMQGPFSYDMNLALLKTIQASYLITKESGRAGGFEEKVAAALNYGCQVIAVGRPVKEEGMSLEEIEAWLRQEYLGKGTAEQEPGNQEEPGNQKESGSQEEPGNQKEPGNQEKIKREIHLVGIGMGDIRQITLEGIQAILDSDAILGASRMVECGRQVIRISAPWEGQEAREVRVMQPLYRPEEILPWLDAHPQIHRPVILYSGDVGFYSGAKGLMEKIQEEKRSITCHLVPGISSMAAFAAKIGRSWEKVQPVSFHGREEELPSLLSEGKECFFLLDGRERLQALCKALLQSGQGAARLWVGERLSYPEERIWSGRPEELLSLEVGSLAVAWLAPVQRELPTRPSDS